MLTNLEFLLLFIVLVSTLVGVYRGLVREVFALLSWVVAFWVSREHSAWLLSFFTFDPSSYWIGVVIVFLAVFLGCRLIALGCRSMLAMVGLGGIDRLLGAGIGALRGGVVCLVLLWLLQGVGVLQVDSWQDSLLTPYFMSVLQQFERFI